MLTIEFEAGVHNGMIEIPKEYQQQLKNHIKLIALVEQETPHETKATYSMEYIQKNWKELVSKGLSSYDVDYYNSDQYKLDRGVLPSCEIYTAPEKAEV